MANRPLASIMSVRKTKQKRRKKTNNPCAGGVNPNTDKRFVKNGKTAAVSGYQIICATDKKFSKNVIKTTVSGKSLSKTVTGLKKGKTYYVKVRAYKTVNGKKIYGLYSNVRSQKL